MKDCAEMVSGLDEKMLSLNIAIQECLEREEATKRHRELIGSEEETVKLWSDSRIKGRREKGEGREKNHGTEA